MTSRRKLSAFQVIGETKKAGAFMANNPLKIRIRAKKLGVLIRDARLAAGKSIQACAKAIQVSDSKFLEYEMAEKSPSLPELEILGFSLKTPFEHFWSQKALSITDSSDAGWDVKKFVVLRHRIIGAKVRQARLNAGLGLKELAEQASIADGQLERYELGEDPIPLPELEILARVVEKPVKEFFDDQGPIGSWATQQRTMQYLTELPTDLMDFINKPVNRPYLELAQRLSEMTADKLRAVAEGLLEITL